MSANPPKLPALRGAGGKGGGGGAELPDSLRSTQTAEVLDLLSEGEIEGIVTGLRGIYLDGVPLQNADGSFNFEGVQVQLTSGTQGQAAITGADGVSNEVGVGINVVAATPVVRTISNAAIDKVRVTIEVPQLTKQESTGDLVGSSFDWAIDLQSAGGGFVTKVTDTVDGKTTSRYTKSFEFTLTGSAPWDVRVRRVSADSSSIAEVNLFRWSSYTEIQSLKLRFPNSALARVRVGAQQFNRIPTRAYDVAGVRVRVPVNYNPLTKVYSGVWNGTFKVAWTDCPAWIFYDLVTNTRYGLGRYFTTTDALKWEMYAVGRYCDELVPDGSGGFEPRFKCGVYLTTREQAYKVLYDLAAVFRGMTYWAGTDMGVVQDAPADSSASFTAANVVGRFTYAGASASKRHNQVVVWFNDLKQFGKLVPEVVVDHELQKRFGIKTLELSPLGVWSRGQAQRIGKWALYSEQYEGQTVAFRAGLDGQQLAPGRIFEVSDPDEAGERMGGRVRSATTAAVTLDAPVTLAAGDAYTLSVMLQDPADAARLIVQKRPVTTGAGTVSVLNVSPAFTAAPAAQSVWLLQGTNLLATSWRCLSVGEVDGENQYEVLGLRHYPQKYALIEQGIKFELPTVSTIKAVPPTPTGIVLTETTYSVGLDRRNRVTISWPEPARGLQYLVSWRLASGPWVDMPATSANCVDVDSLPALGLFEAQVKSRNALGRTSPPAYESLEMTGGLAPEIRLVASQPGFSFGGGGTPRPASQTISIRAELVSLAGTVAMTCTLYNALDSVLGTATLGGTGSTRTLAVADFGAAAYAKVVATLGAYTGQATLARFQDGEIGGDGWSVYQCTVYQASATQPLPPQGGSYTFTGEVFEAPALWTRTIPESNLPRWASHYLFRTLTPDIPIRVGGNAPGVATTVTGGIVTNVPGGDPYMALLLHMDGPDNGTAFVDSSPSPKAVTVSGGVKLTLSSGPVFGGIHAIFSATPGAQGRLSIADHEDLNLGSGPFTLGFFVLPFDASGSGLLRNLVNKRVGASAVGPIEVRLTTANKLQVAFSIDGTNQTVFTGTTNVTQTGGHKWVEIVRSGTTIYVFLDGLLEVTGTLTGPLFTNTAALNIGSNSDFSSPMAGCIDEFVLFKGKALHTSNFNRPTRQFEAVSYPVEPGVILQLRMQGAPGSLAFTDDAGNALTTYVGSAGAQSLALVDTDLLWGATTAQFGIGPQSSFISPSNWAAFKFQTGNLRVSAWIKPSQTSGSLTICSNHDTQGLFTGWALSLQAGVLTIFAYGQGQNSVNLSGGPVIPTNVYTFVEARRVSGVWSLYVGKDRVATGAQAVEIRYSPGTPNFFRVGFSALGTTTYFRGKIGEIQISNIAGDVGATTAVPTASFGVAGDLRDLYADYTKLLLLFNEAPGATTFVDSSFSRRAPTVTAPVAIDAGQTLFGLPMASFTGGYIQYPDSDDWDLGSGDGGCDMYWVPNAASMGAKVTLFGQADASGNGAPVTVSKGTDNKLTLSGNLVGGGTYSVTSTLTVAAGLPYYIEFAKKGGDLYLFVNGDQWATVQVTAALAPSSALFGVGVLGQFPSTYGGAAGARLMGWLKYFRWSKGVARHEGPYAQPVAGAPVPTVVSNWTNPPVRIAVNGADGTSLRLGYTAQTFTFNGSDVATPTSQTITFTAILGAGVTGTGTFVATLFNASGTSLGTVTMGGSGNTRTLTVAQFGAAQSCVVVLTLGTYADQVTVVKLKDGVGGAGLPGQNAINGVLSNESTTVAADPNGVVASFAGSGGVFRVWDGLNEKTGLASVAYSVIAGSVSGGLSISIDASGVYTISDLTTDHGSATLQAIYNGVTLTKSFDITKARAGFDGVDAIVMRLSRDSVVVSADSTGYVATFAGASTQASVALGTEDDTPNWTFSVEFGPEVTVMVSGANIAIGSLSTDSASVRVIASRAGFPNQYKVFNVVKARSASPVGSGPLSGMQFVAETRSNLPPARIKFKVDGTVQVSDYGGGYRTVGNWASPAAAGTGNSFWIQIVNSTGYNDPSGPATYAWHAMSADLEWFGASYPGAYASYKISSSSTGAPVVGDGSIFMNVYSNWQGSDGG